MKAAIFFIVAFVIFSVVTTPMAACAGEASTLNILGSSIDGRYVAYEQYGIMDGSGSPYSIIDVRDLQTGQPVLDGFLEGQREGESRSLAAVRRDALLHADLGNWNIELGRTGTPLVQHLITDIQADPAMVSFTTQAPLYGCTPSEYSLRLKTYPTGQECRYGYGQAHYAELTLYNWTEASQTPFGGQIQPQSAAPCALDYRIQEVRLLPGSPNHLLVFLNIYKPGFEGHSMGFMLVSGDFD